MSEAQNIDSNPRSLQVTALLSFAIWVLGISLLFWPFVGHQVSSTLWADDFDSNLLKWIAEWGFYSLGQQHSLSLFWNANSFFPEKLTLAYSDSLLSLQLFYTPLRMLGVQQLTALYLSLALLTLLGVSLSVVALSRFRELSNTEVAIATFMAHFSLSLTNFLGHYQLFGFQLVPPFFLFLYWYLQDFKARDLVATVTILSLAVSCAIYLAPMLMVVGGLFVAPLLIRKFIEVGPLKLIRLVGWRAPLLASCLLGVLYWIQLKPYFELANLFPPQLYEESKQYSATLLSIVNLHSINSYWYAPTSGQYSTYGDWERAYAPGFAALLILLLFAVRMLSVGLYGMKLELKLKQLTVMALYLAVISYGLSLGPLIGEGNHHGPFWYVSEATNSFRSLRAPGRFGMFLGLPIGILCVALLRDLRANRLVQLATFIAISVDALTSFRVFPYSESKAAVYREVSRVIEPNTPILELPVCAGEHIANIRIIMEQLNGGSYHHGRIVPGYGGKTTQAYQQLLDLDCKVRDGKSDPSALLEFGRSLGINHLLLHKKGYPEAVQGQWDIQMKNKKILIQVEGSDFVALSERSN